MAAVSPKNVRPEEDGWLILPVALTPGPSEVDQRVFVLKNEDVQSLTL